MFELSTLSYIDPVSGALVVQAVVATVVGAAAFFRRSLWQLVSLVFRRRPTEVSPQESESNR